MIRRVLLPLLACALLLPGLGLLTAGPAAADRSGQAVRRLVSCGTPRLAPAVAPARRVAGLSPADRRVALGTLREARAARLPVRAQAILLMVRLPGARGDALRRGSAPALPTRALVRRLRAVKGWETQPPELVAHRLLGTPDPYAFEGRWPAALAVLAKASASSRARVTTAVATGARAGRACVPPGGRALPVPAGSGFSLLQEVSARSTQPSKPRKAGKKGAKKPGARAAAATAGDGAGSLLLGAACGTPVLASTAGTVSVDRRDREAGPWAITVAQGDTRTTYAHIDRPLVRDGAKVDVGDQLATVGSHGWIDRCALGFTLRIGGTRLTREEAATWLMPAPERRSPPRRGRPDVSEDVTTAATTPLRITTFNVLGAHLTGPGSDRPSYAAGSRRMAVAMGHLNAAGSSIAVFQEFESPQAAVVAAAPGWQLHRATGNSYFRDGNYSGNAIAWRTDTWDLVSTSEFSVPWQVRLNMPVVQLRHVTTGAVVVVIGVHNPASTANQGDQSRSRGLARSIEKQYVASVVEQSGLPVLLAGDLNERDEAICDFAAAGLDTWHQRGGGCGSWGYGGVDHVFVDGPVGFGSLSVDRSTLGRVSDHPMVTASVTLNP